MFYGGCMFYVEGGRRDERDLCTHTNIIMKEQKKDLLQFSCDK